MDVSATYYAWEHRDIHLRDQKELCLTHVKSEMPLNLKRQM